MGISIRPPPNACAVPVKMVQKGLCRTVVGPARHRYHSINQPKRKQGRDDTDLIGDKVGKISGAFGDIGLPDLDRYSEIEQYHCSHAEAHPTPGNHSQQQNNDEENCCMLNLVQFGQFFNGHRRYTVLKDEKRRRVHKNQIKKNKSPYWGSFAATASGFHRPGPSLLSVTAGHVRPSQSYGVSDCGTQRSNKVCQKPRPKIKTAKLLRLSFLLSETFG